MYPGGWVHNLKAQGLPALQVPADAKESWIVKSQDKFQRMLETFLTTINPNMTGMRFEVRCQLVHDTWQDQHTDLQEIFKQVSPRLKAIVVPVADVLSHLATGMRKAIDAGVFRTAYSRMDRQVPDWKRTAFNRLLHRVGLANKFTNRHTYNAEKDDLPWGRT